MDEGELEAELEGLEQEAMDERMLNTGPTPVGTRLEGLPAAGSTERKFYMLQAFIERFSSAMLTTDSQQATRNRGRRRGGRTGQAQSRNGHVARHQPLSTNIRICTSFCFRLFGCRGGVLVFITHALDAFLLRSYLVSKPCISFSFRVSWR